MDEWTWISRRGPRSAKPNDYTTHSADSGSARLLNSRSSSSSASARILPLPPGSNCLIVVQFPAPLCALCGTFVVSFRVAPNVSFGDFVALLCTLTTPTIVAWR